MPSLHIKNDALMKRLLAVLLLSIIVGCGGVHLDPTHIEQRDVTPVPNENHVLTLNEPEVWYNGQPPRIGIQFPAGTYKLEAQDGSFLYFRAPTKIEMRRADADRRAMDGGIALRKDSAIDGVVAEAYIEDENQNPGKKTLIWRLGTDFERLRGTKWSTNVAPAK
jgi:hypothetical protein